MVTNHGPGLYVRIGEDMVLSHIHEFKDKMEGLASLTHTLEVDFSGVNQIDFSGIQLILALWKQARLNGISIHMEACSPVLLATLQLLGLESHLAEK